MLEEESNRYSAARWLEHPAMRAWTELRPTCVEPQQIETLDTEKKSAVYLLPGVGPQGSAVIAKQCSKSPGFTERTVYEEILPHVPARTLGYYGFVSDPNSDRCWLFLEDAGPETYSSGIQEHRVLAAQSLGLMHVTSARLTRQVRLPDRGPTHYLNTLRSMRSTILENITNRALRPEDVLVLKAIVSQFEVLESRWSQVEVLCAHMPQTLVHGDFAEKNVRLRMSEAGLVLLAFDWEAAGWGTPAADLAQFILGSVSPDIATYVSIVRPYWPYLNLQEVQHLASIGTIFRLIESISWEQYGLVYERWAHRGLAFECAKWTMGELRAYRAQLDDAIQSAPWEAERR
jgi:hypothetical protein